MRGQYCGFSVEQESIIFCRYCNFLKQGILYPLFQMNLLKAPDTFASRIPIFVFAAGIAFSAVIWLLHIFWMVCVGTPPGNYYVSMPYAGLSYIHLCTLNFSGFIILGLITLVFGERKIISAALIVSCLAIGANTLLMKASFRIGHLTSMQGLVEGLQEFDPYDQEGRWYHYPSMVLFNHEALTVDVRRWNEVEAEKFEPDVELVSLVGDWTLKTDEYAGICRFECEDFYWAFDFSLKVNGEIWGKKKYRPRKILQEDGVFKIVLCISSRYPADYVYKSRYTNLVSSLEESVYLEMAPDKQSFFMYRDETKKGESLGPFVRQ